MSHSWLVVVAISISLGCSRQSETTPTKGGTPPKVATPRATPNRAEVDMKIESSAFAHEAAIPKKYTCEGDDLSPPLKWSDVPDGTKTFALVVSDPDAPDPAAPKMTWVHWVLYDIPATVRSLQEGIEDLPQGTRAGKNDWKRTGYGGPCPPIGRHRYFFELYALDTMLGDRGDLTKSELEKNIEGHVLAQATLMGSYQKSGK